MPTDKELMQQALDALEVEHSAIYGTSQTEKAIEALRARLAQPEQKHSEQWWRHEVSNAYANGYEKGRVFCGCGDQIMPNDGAECGNCVAARNAVKQEPIAQMREMLEVQGRDGTWNYDAYSQGMYNGMEFMMALSEGREPVFREPPEKWLHTPPERRWQWLTEEEIDKIANSASSKLSAVFLAESQLRGKNAL